MRRGQASLEYLIITVAVLSVTAVTVLFLTGAFGGAGASAQLSACKQAASDCSTQKLVSPSATCSSCETACVDSNGKDVMNNVVGCGLACVICKRGQPEEIGSEKYVFFEDFSTYPTDSTASPPWTITHQAATGDEWSVTTDGAYKTSSRAEWTQSYVSVPNSDATYVVKIKLGSAINAWAGYLIRGQGPGSYDGFWVKFQWKYVWLANNDKYTIRKVDTRNIPGAPELQPNTWYWLKAVVSGNNFKIYYSADGTNYYNCTPSEGVTDSSYSSGTTFALIADTSFTAYSFDDINIIKS